MRYRANKESVTPTLPPTTTPTPTGSAPKTICSLPFGGGHNQKVIFIYLPKFRCLIFVPSHGHVKQATLHIVNRVTSIFTEVENQRWVNKSKGEIQTQI